MQAPPGRLRAGLCPPKQQALQSVGPGRVGHLTEGRWAMCLDRPRGRVLSELKSSSPQPSSRPLWGADGTSGLASAGPQGADKWPEQVALLLPDPTSLGPRPACSQGAPTSVCSRWLCVTQDLCHQGTGVLCVLPLRSHSEAD